MVSRLVEMSSFQGYPFKEGSTDTSTVCSQIIIVVYTRLTFYTSPPHTHSHTPPPPPQNPVMMYKGLLDGYRYDESMTQSLFIPGMEAPPPIPPKKRKRPVCPSCMHIHTIVLDIRVVSQSLIFCSLYFYPQPQSSHAAAAAAAPPGQTVINTSTLSKPELNASTEEVFK